MKVISYVSYLLSDKLLTIWNMLYLVVSPLKKMTNTDNKSNIDFNALINVKMSIFLCV